MILHRCDPAARLLVTSAGRSMAPDDTGHPVPQVPATTLATRMDALVAARGLMPQPARFTRADPEAV